MSASDEFKQELRQKNLTGEQILKAMQAALSEAIELKVTTWVVPAEEDAIPEEPKPGHRMCTHINIVDGAIENEVGSEFLSNGPYSELREFHLEQVKQGREIIQDNLENIQHLFGVLSTTLQKLSPPSHPPAPKRPRSLLAPPESKPSSNGGTSFS